MYGQNVGIGTATPNPSAKLDIVDPNRGLLVPRVALSATNVAAPVTNPANGLLVFNTATAGAAPNNVTPGFYYWNAGANRWVRLDDNAWRLTGNAGTNPSVNFIGTRDNADFVVRTNNTERMRVTAQGRVGIGTATPGYILDVAARMRVRGGAGATSAGIWFYQTTTSTDRAFVGMVDDNYVGFWGQGGAGWGFAMNVNDGRVGIGTTTPHLGSRLHVVGNGSQGVLLPSVALTTATSWSPVVGPATPGMLVYNTADAGSGLGRVTPGYYYWDGARWIPMRHLYPVLGGIDNPNTPVPGTCTCPEGNPNPCQTPLGSYIDLPPGKWAVLVFAPAGTKSSTGIPGDASVSGRMNFFENANCTGAYYGFTVGRIVGPENHGIVGTNYVVITNTTNAVKRYHTCGCVYVTYNCTGCGFTEWFNAQMIAFPLAP